MDSRHESFKEGLLNQLITIINNYIKDNTDELVIDHHTLIEISDICKRIYRYLGVEVDINGILSKHNLLSIDVVLFPHIPDPESRKILNESDFQTLMTEIKSISNKKTTHQ